MTVVVVEGGGVVFSYCELVNTYFCTQHHITVQRTILIVYFQFNTVTWSKLA